MYPIKIIVDNAKISVTLIISLFSQNIFYMTVQLTLVDRRKSTLSQEIVPSNLQTSSPFLVSKASSPHNTQLY